MGNWVWDPFVRRPKSAVCGCDGSDMINLPAQKSWKGRRVDVFFFFTFPFFFSFFLCGVCVVWEVCVGMGFSFFFFFFLFFFFPPPLVLLLYILVRFSFLFLTVMQGGKEKWGES